ncbi:MAG TPA: hypothetical protein VN851_17075 [Thermoanaerobaculia bacterium]|nr:hypothetical protein [Thermoanaerobaculia bacterium]
MLRKLRETTTRHIPAATLALFLAAAPALAANPAPSRDSSDFAAGLRGAFSQIWNRLALVREGLGGIWAAIGMDIDPHGQPVPPPQGIGMDIDPHG